MNDMINESPNWSSVPKSKEKDWATLTLGNERKIFIPGVGWQFPATARNFFRAKGDPNWNKIPNPPQPSTPKPSPPRQRTRQDWIASGALGGKEAFISGGGLQAMRDNPSLTAADVQRKGMEAIRARERSNASSGASGASSGTPASSGASGASSGTPASSGASGASSGTPASSGASGASSGTPTPSPAPARPSPATPAPPAIPLETRMSSVTNKKEFVGTSPSGEKFERRAATSAELRAAQQARNAALGANKSRPEAEKSAVSAGIAASKKTQTEEKMEAFNIVLEYLVSEGHVDTLDEALYVMMEMNSDTIQDICEAHYGTAKGRKRLAKKVRAGKDVGKKGPGFEAVVDKATPKYGKARATKISAAAMWKNLGK